MAAEQSIGRYAIHREIASGGMASVHLGRLAGPAGFARTVAIKRAHPHLARDKEFALMFMDEARLAARIHHPNVVPVLDVLETGNELVLVMEYVHGEPLSRLVFAASERGGPVPAPIAASILIDTLHGLHAAHEATNEQGEPLGIVHRDVSPQNILVGVDGITRLVDFGIAKAAGRLHQTRNNTVKGKHAYMAPEQVRGQAVSRLTDIYAASIVFWEMLTGRRLFAGKTEAETIHNSLASSPLPPSHFARALDPRIDAILAKGLARAPADRYRTARAMALDIESCMPAIRPSEVGAWVTEIAGDHLAARAEVVAHMEREASTGKGKAALATPDPYAVSSITSSAIEVGAQAPGRARRNLVWMVGVTVVLYAFGATALKMRDHGRDIDARRPAPSSASSSPPAAAVVAPPASAAPSAVPVPVTPPAAVHAAPSAKAPAPSATPRTEGKHGAPNCDPPYVVDAQGRILFKHKCL